MSVILYLSIGFLSAIVLATITQKNAYLSNLFSENKGQGSASFGRFGAYHALIASIAWVTWIVYKTSTIPDLTGVIFFIATLYSINKLHDVFKYKFGNGKSN